MRDFIKKGLGPELQKAHPNVDIIAHDDQKPLLMKTAEVIMSDPETAQYVAGFGVHWYGQMDGWLGWGYDSIKSVKDRYDDKYIIATEACE
eukprot:Pgem_evm1s642